MSDKYLLDASALLALLQNEPGSQTVARHFHYSAISAVNLAEVAGVLNQIGMPHEEIHELFDELDLEILPYEKYLAIATGGIRHLTRKKDCRGATERAWSRQNIINTSR